MDYSGSPTVSVIIAFLNEEAFLEEAIASVLRQDYQSWELLLVDDGSTDQSTAIARQYAAQFPDKIIYCEHAQHLNKGLSASRNHGIEQSSGSLIAILDADDIWLPNKLSSQVAVFREHPDVAMLAEASLYWYSWNDPQREDIAIPLGAPADKVYQPTELLFLLYPLGKGAAPCPSGLMIARQAFLTAGGFEESFTKENQLYEDQAFLNKIYLKEKVYVSAACNNQYRQRAGSIVQAVIEQGHYHQVRKYFLEWYVSYLHKNNVINKPVQKLVDKALMPYRHPLLYKATHFSWKRLLTGLFK
ncbi:glycosyltransferase family 2 protein [Hymenobacter terrenus]|uniref:glycosyltransferase family 2 protein n=1 Tax=Hymenobacter terrenus TaxID=1629124 RepID=UPI000619B53D|nr:glycosyltransferase family A protein [Hymenobacter terrenus]